jgi:Methyltransferase domain
VVSGNCALIARHITSQRNACSESPHDGITGTQAPLYLLLSSQRSFCVGAPYYGDGPKFVCGMEFLTEKADCLVYSIGSRAEDGFELDLLSRAPNCEVSIRAATAAVERICRQCLRSLHSDMRSSSSSSGALQRSSHNTMITLRSGDMCITL